MRSAIINLENFRVKVNGVKSKVFTGRDRGAEVRKASKIDSLESQYDHIEIVVPSDIYSINPSFFEEFLRNVVSKIGKEEFLKRFTLKSEGQFDYTTKLLEAIDRILNSKTAIG